MRGIVISNVGRLHDDPEIERPPSARGFQILRSQAEMSEHADGIFAFLFRPAMRRLSQLFCTVQGLDLGRIPWSRQGRERLDHAIVGGLDGRSPHRFRPGSFPALAGLIRNDWLSLVGVEGPEREAVAAFREYAAARRACRLPKAQRQGAEVDADALQAVERAFVETQASIFIRGWDGVLWEAYCRDPALVVAMREHLEGDGRVSLKEGALDPLWRSLRAV